MHRLLFLTLSVLSISFFTIAPANAQLVYIKIGDIEGGSTYTTHEGKIDVLSWSWGVERPTVSDDGGARTRGNPEVLDLVIGKALEKSTPKLFEACLTGQVYPEAILEVYKPDNTGADRKRLEIKLTNVSITSGDLAGSLLDTLETMRMNFETIAMTYFTSNPDGTVEMSYNVETGL